MVSNLEARAMNAVRNGDELNVLTRNGIVSAKLASKEDMGYESACIIIDPECAQRLLESNIPRNRNISNSTIAKYAEDMKNGEWLSSACEPITLSANGELINGQHRLAAIVRTGVAIPTEVRLGVDEKAYNFFDQGKKRAIADGINVSKNGRAIASLCTYALSVAYYGGFNGYARASVQNGKVTKSGVINMCDSIEGAHPGLLSECARIAKRVGEYGWPAQAVGTGLLAMYFADSDTAEKLFEDLFSPLPPNESFYSFRTYAADGKTKAYTAPVRKHLTVYALSKCWNTYYGAKPTKIKYSKKSMVDIVGFDIEMFRQFAPQTREEQ